MPSSVFLLSSLIFSLARRCSHYEWELFYKSVSSQIQSSWLFIMSNITQALK